MTITHTKRFIPYNGNNPNNCSSCGCESATWGFNPIDSFGNKHELCNTCISNGEIFKLGIKIESSLNDLIRFNHN